MSAISFRHGTTRVISSRNSRLRVRLVDRFKPRSICVITSLLEFSCYQDNPCSRQCQDFCRDSISLMRSERDHVERSVPFLPTLSTKVVHELSLRLGFLTLRYAPAKRLLTWAGRK